MQEHPSPLKPVALFIVGERAVGKTTLVRTLIAGRRTKPISDRITTLIRANAPVKWTEVEGDRLILAGHYTGGTYDGADTCDQNQAAHIDYWEQHFAAPGLVTILDGDRFSFVAAKERFGRHATLRCVHVTAPEVVTAARRAQRPGAPRTDIEQKRAKSAKFANTFAPTERLNLDGTEPSETLLAKLLAWLPEIQCDREAPRAPRLPEASTSAVGGGEPAEEAIAEAPAADALSILVETGEAASEAPAPAPSSSTDDEPARGGEEPRERRTVNVRTIATKTADGPSPPPAGTTAHKVRRVGALLVRYEQKLGIYAHGDRIVEIVEIDRQPRVYALAAEPLGLKIEEANAHAGNLCAPAERVANDDEAQFPDDLTTAFVHRYHLSRYGARVLALHAWQDTDGRRMRVLRGIQYAGREQALGYDEKTQYFYTKDTATENVEDGTLRFLKSAATIGHFSSKMLLDAKCKNWASPKKTEAQRRAYDENGVFDALASLPCDAYASRPGLHEKTVGEVIDLLRERVRSSDTGVEGQVSAVLRGLLERRPIAIEHDCEGKALAIYEIVCDGKSHDLATNPNTWHVSVRTPEPTTPEPADDRDVDRPESLDGTEGNAGSEMALTDAAESREERHEKDGLVWRESRDGAGVLRLDLTGDGLLSVDQVDALEGHFVDDTSYARLLRNESVDVYRPDGTLLLALRKGVFSSSLTRPAHRILRRAAQPSKNRGAAAGLATAEGLHRDPATVILRGMTASYITEDGQQSNTSESNQVRSGIVGYFNATPRNPYCRQTAFSQDRFRRLGLYAMPLIEAIDQQFAATAPERHRAQHRFVDENRLRENGWVLGGTAFSTVTVNSNFRTAVHRDAGDYPGGFGNLTVLEGPRHRYEGGYLVFPRFRVAVDVRAGDFLAMDVHEWHGNTALRAAVDGEDEWERVSVVCYAREAIARCGTADEENAKYEFWLRTEHEAPSGRHAADVPAPPPLPALPPPPAATTSAAGTAATYDPITWPAFVAFAAEELRSGDLDPIYPVLRHVYAADGLSEPIAVWRTLLYLATYDLESAERLWTLLPEPGSLPVLTEKLRFGSNRRGMRVGEHLREHLDSILSASDGAPDIWLRRLAAPGGEEGWRAVRAAAGRLRHNGPYFSYKVADLLRHVHGFAIAADSIGDKPGCGPFAGMMRLTGLAANECTVARQHHLLDTARAAGVSFAGLDELETALCAFNAVARGDHYCGADIDQLHETLSEMDPKWWTARRASFPAEYLGEDHGRRGITKALLRRYRDAGELVRSDGHVIWRRA